MTVFLSSSTPFRSTKQQRLSAVCLTISFLLLASLSQLTYVQSFSTVQSSSLISRGSKTYGDVSRNPCQQHSMSSNDNNKSYNWYESLYDSDDDDEDVNNINSFDNLHMSSRDSDDNRVDDGIGNSKELKELDEMRLQFERTVLLEQETVPVHESTRLTTSAQHYKEIELRLLKTLYTSDESLSALTDVWLQETLPEYKDGEYSKEVDMAYDAKDVETLLSFVTKFSHWTEPLFKLAIVYYHKEQYSACQHYLNELFSIKPWHFDGRSLQLLLILAKDKQQRNNGGVTSPVGMASSIDALRAVRMALPPLSQRSKRRDWVDAAVLQASSHLHQRQQLETTTHQFAYVNELEDTEHWQ